MNPALPTHGSNDPVGMGGSFGVPATKAGSGDRRPEHDAGNGFDDPERRA
jgi:hypothetical protein